MPSTYTAFNNAKPAGADTGPLFATNANANDVALWYGAMSGALPGYAYSQIVGTGTAEQPQFQLWTNGTTIVRHTNTWGAAGGAAGNLSTVLIEVSTDTGTNYATIGTVTNTFDASGNLTATSGASSGFLGWLSYLVGKVKALLSAFNTHTGTTTGAHGTGSLALQASTAVNIDGGTIDATPIGQTVRAEGNFTRACEQSASYAPVLNAGVTLSWANGGSIITTNGVNILTFSNVPAAPRVGVHVVSVTNLNNTTFPAAVTWGLGGKPSVAGAAVVTMATFDGGTTVYAGILYRAV